MSRKLLSILSGIVLIPLLVQAATTRFTDVPVNAWFSSYVEMAVDMQIVGGYLDAYGRSTGRFGPEKAVTIAEALKIALESAGYDESRGVGYGHWAARYLSIATGENFELMRVPNLNIDRAATRAEVA